MIFHPRVPARTFRAGGIEIAHTADVELSDDEQVTFTSPSGSEYDVVRKAWGYYATPSLNRRLPDHGLRPALCRNADGRTTVLLCEDGADTLFAAYLADHGMELLTWLDGDVCPMCSAASLHRWHRYERPPEGETHFDLHDRPYQRDLLQCAQCGHFVSRTELDLASLYTGEYMDATYAGDKLSATFERIMSLPPERSDNAARVARILTRTPGPARLLDVGSGLGVFPARMKEAGWDVTALDPDARAVKHAREVADVAAIHADFLTVEPASVGRFDLVTLNKVLEHVPDPATMLRRARDFLVEDGLVYVELPDGEAAAAEGPGREEFFVEHLHVFSPASVALLVRRAELRIQEVRRLREPSSKYTVYAFCS